MMTFRRLQSLLAMIAMPACLLSYAAAQPQDAASTRPQRHVASSGAMRDVETLFALSVARIRKPLQDDARSRKQDGNADAIFYHVFEIGPQARRYRIADWRAVRATRGTAGGLAGDWAEVAEKTQNRKGEWGDQGGWSLYHRVKGHWQRIASHEGLGYAPNIIRKAEVPRQIIQRLKLEINE